MRIGIDASNIGGGGGVTHLREIISNLYYDNRVEEVIVFASKKVLNQLPDNKLVKKKTFPFFNKSLFHRILFQLWKYDSYIRQDCDILLSVTGDYLGKFNPVVGMSRNMLLYERAIWKEIKQPKEIVRFWLNFLKQKRCFKNASAIIFISNYAREYISKKLCLNDKNKTVIHHGISTQFIGNVKEQIPINSYSLKNPFKLLYVSTVHIYKHQWNVVLAIAKLRQKGYPVELDLVGDVIFKPAGKKLVKTLKKTDPKGEFVRYHGHIQYSEIHEFYKIADGIVFASTCENMPNILIESMASGLPISCSNKQPMPEFLKENGFYFNAKDVDSIENAIEDMLNNPELREKLAKKNLQEIQNYSWAKTTKETFNYILQIGKN